MTGVAVDANGDYTVTIELGDTAGTSTTTPPIFRPRSPLADGAAALITATATGAGASEPLMPQIPMRQLVPSSSPGGQNTTNNDVTFTDNRAVANRDDFNVAVNFVATAANQTLGVEVVEK